MIVRAIPDNLIILNVSLKKSHDITATNTTESDNNGYANVISTLFNVIIQIIKLTQYKKVPAIILTSLKDLTKKLMSILTIPIFIMEIFKSNCAVVTHKIYININNRFFTISVITSSLTLRDTI